MANILSLHKLFTLIDAITNLNKNNVRNIFLKVFNYYEYEIVKCFSSSRVNIRNFGRNYLI